MRVTFPQPAADGEQLAPGFLDSAIGREYPIEVEGCPAAAGVITEAVVLPGGQSVSLTLDIPDDSRAALAISGAAGGGPGPFSVAEDGTVARPFPIRRRTPEEAAAYLATLDIKQDVKDLIEDTFEEMRRDA
jgi:hypothetical protein